MTRAVGTALAAAVIMVAACSSSGSTAPSDPLAGSWRVTLPRFADSTYFVPSPFTLSITKSAAGDYSASYPDLAYHMSGGGLVDTYTSTRDSSTFSVSGASFMLRVGAPIASCVLTVQGAANGATAGGAFSLHNGCGPNPAEAGVWTATKQ